MAGAAAGTAGKLAGTLSSAAKSSAGKSVVSGAGKALNGFGTAASGAGQVASAGTSAVSGAAWAGGAAIAGQVNNIMQDRGFILFLGGLVFFVLKVLGVQIGGISSTILSVLGTFLLIYSGFVFFGSDEKGAWITIIYFYIWGILLGFKGLQPFDPSYLTWVGSIFVVITISFMLLFKKNGFSENFKEEIVGFLPIVIYFLDVGVLAQLVAQYGFLNLSGALENFILWVPWFALLGVFNIKVRGSLPTIIKTGAFIYLFILVTIIAIPSMGFQESNELFNPEDALAADQEYRENYQGPNPVLLYVDCFGELMSNIGTGESKTVDECITEKLLEDELSYICTNDWGYTEGTPEHGQCVIDEEARLEEEQQTVSGTIDQSFTEHTEVELTINRNTFPSEKLVAPGSQDYLNYPITFEILNPRELTLDAEFSCNFTSNTNNGDSFMGNVMPSSFETIEEDDDVSIICSPPNDQTLNGSYTITYFADIYNLETSSYLTRLFVEKEDIETEIVQRAINTYVSGSDVYYSAAPDEFARINFAFGNPESNPVVEVTSEGYADLAESNVMLVSSIENVANGKITTLNNYNIILEPDLYPSEDDWACLQDSGYDVILPNTMRSGDTIPLSICFLDMYDSLVEDVYLESFVPRSYVATLSYDYQISESTDITVTIVG